MTYRYKIYIKYFLIATVALSIFWIVRNIYTRVIEKKRIEKNTSTMPAFAFTSFDNTVYTNLDIKTDKVIINYFDPGCEHCQYMAKRFVSWKERDNEYSVIMVTVADSAKTRDFAVRYRLDKTPGIVVLLDRDFQCSRIFGLSIIPSFLTYKYQKLIKRIYGEVKIENLLID